MDERQQINALLEQPNLFTPPTCKTCRHWAQEYPENLKLGRCKIMGALKGENEIGLTTAYAGVKPVSDFGGVNTVADFGCNHHSNFISQRI
jgi:hypothetical protein